MSVYKNGYLSEAAADILGSYCLNTRQFDAFCGCYNGYFVNFDHVHSHIVNSLDARDFKLCILQLAHCIQGTVKCLRETDFNAYRIYCEWTNLTSVLEVLIRECNRSDPISKLLSVMHSSSILEFALGNLLWTEKSGCPNNMKDILLSDKLNVILQHEIISIISVFCGTVNSLNLRNLVWHAFVSPTHARQLHEDLPWFMFVLIINIGKHLTDKSFADVPSRPFLLGSLELCDKILIHIGIDNFNFSLHDLSLAHPMFTTTSIELLDAIDCLGSSSVARYLDSSALCLLCLTIILRNELSKHLDWESGVFSSESRFFITLDTVLQCNFDGVIDDSVCVSFATIERFSKSIGPTLLLLLSDALSHEAGPRIKDRFSHGQLWSPCYSSCNLQFKTTSELLKICLAEILLATSQPHGQSTKKSVCKLDDYQPVFHPLYIMHHALEELQTSLKVVETDFTECSPPDCPVLVEAKTDSLALKMDKLFSWFQKYTFSNNQNLKLGVLNIDGLWLWSVTPVIHCRIVSQNNKKIAQLTEGDTSPDTEIRTDNVDFPNKIGFSQNTFGYLDSNRKKALQFCDSRLIVVYRLTSVCKKLINCASILTEQLKRFRLLDLDGGHNDRTTNAGKSGRRSNIERLGTVVPVFIVYAKSVFNFILAAWNEWIWIWPDELTESYTTLACSSEHDRPMHSSVYIDWLDVTDDFRKKRTKLLLQLEIQSDKLEMFCRKLHWFQMIKYFDSLQLKAFE